MSNTGIEIMRSDIDNLLKEQQEMRLKIQILEEQVSELQTEVACLGR